MIDNRSQPAQIATAVPTYKVGFMADMVAGHVTHYRNLQTVVAQDASLQPVYNEIIYKKEGGFPEKIYDRFSFLPYYPFGIYRASRIILKGLRKANYDAIFINSRVGVFFTHFFKRTPTILDTDVTPIQLDKLEGYAGKEDSGVVAKLKYKLFKDFVHSTKLVLAWSEWARQSFIQDYGLPPERVVVNPPGVNLAYWQPPQIAKSADAPVRLLFVGGDFKRKGGEMLLKWFAQQPAGTCELDIVTREKVAPQPGITLYYDMKPNTPELLHLYQNADIFVLPSSGECFGIATIEAMACGLPVVQTDVGGVHDIITEGENGYIIKPKDINALNQALQSLLTDPQKRLQMGRAGRKIAEQKFDVAANAQQIVDYLKQVSK